MSLLIGVDYDGTYSADPDTFDNVISEFRTAGHQVIIVTARSDQDAVSVNPSMNLEVYYTCGEPKDPYMREQHNRGVDIWIEDRPHGVGTSDDWEFDPEKAKWYREIDGQRWYPECDE